MHLPIEWEDKFCVNVANHLKDNNVSNYIDIGAHIGQAIYYFSKKHNINFQQILAFEPDLDNFHELVKNTEGLPIKCQNVGIFYGLSECQACGAGDNSRAGYFLENLDYLPNQVIKYPKKIFTLSELEPFTSEYDPNNTFIKIDVEGSEYKILECSTFIPKCRFLMLEFHNRPNTEILSFVSWYCAKHNYRIIYESLGRHFFLEKIND